LRERTILKNAEKRHNLGRPHYFRLFWFMEFLFAFAFIAIGLAILITGADTLVKGAASLSKRA
jgi:hypothetical protein